MQCLKVVSRRRGAVCRVAGRRHAYIPAVRCAERDKKEHQRPVVETDKVLKWTKSINMGDSKQLDFKIRQLKEFTRLLKEQMKKAEQMEEKESESTTSGIEEHGADVLYRVISGPAAHSTMLPSNADSNLNLSTIILNTEKRQIESVLPKILSDRIADNKLLAECLLDKRHQDWNTILSKLYSTKERLRGVSKKTLNCKLLTTMSHLSFENIEKLDEMLLESVNGEISKFTIPMYECLFYHLANISPCKQNEVLAKMKTLLQRLDSTRNIDKVTIQPTQFLLNSCIKYASKLQSFEDMNFFLSKFKNDYSIIPNKVNYTTIIQFYTKLGVSKQAWDVFDTMKFLSKKHSPDLTTYNAVLNLCNKSRDYSRALDIYNEMLEKKIQPSANTFNILAKTLATASGNPLTSEGKAESLRLLGWKFVHSIEDNALDARELVDSEFTLETMLALCAYDGDVGLARALYYNYTSKKYKTLRRQYGTNIADKAIWQRTLNPRMLNYLLLAYSNYKSDRLPLLLGYESGMSLRRNIINSADYSGRVEHDDDDDARIRIPMLPVSDIFQPWEILSESRAIWHFNLEYGGMTNLQQGPKDFGEAKLLDIINSSKTEEELKVSIMKQIAKWKSDLVNHTILNRKLLTTFLTIPIKIPDKTEFTLRLHEFTFQQNDFDCNIKKLYAKTMSISDRSTLAETVQKQVNVISKNKDISTIVQYFGSLKHKLLADCSTYDIMMKAALAFEDEPLATSAWQKRGEFRKTLSFQKMPLKDRVESDSNFAKLMVEFFTKKGMLNDALGIILSSKKSIRWNYSMVKQLHLKLVEIEDTKSIRILLDVINSKSNLQIIDEKLEELRLC